MTGRVDAHQHYWTLSLGHNNWPTPELPAIYRDFTPADLEPHLTQAGIERTVLVQAAPNLAETEFLLSLAETQTHVAGVVGWVDLLAADAHATLQRLAQKPKFKGIRPMLQGVAETAWILRADVLDRLATLPAMGLRFDALIQPRHLPVIAALADHLPDLPIVVDHAAKPFIARGQLEPWRSDMAALALRGNVCVKLSGLVTEAGDDWTVDSLRPYADHLITCFTPQRMMFGSDWPVVELQASYGRWVETAEALTSGLSADERAMVFGGTATRFYGL